MIIVGFPPNPGNIPSYPNTPPSSIPFSSGSSTQSNAAVAAAAAVMQAANSRYPLGHQSAEQSPHSYSSHDNMAGSQGRMPSSNTMPSSGIPGMETDSPGNAMETGEVNTQPIHIS